MTKTMLSILQAAARTRRVERRKKNAAAFDQLVRMGLLDAEGNITDAGRTFVKNTPKD